MANNGDSSENLTNGGQPKRPGLNRHHSDTSQVNDYFHHRAAKNPRHVVGGARFHSRVPSSKGLALHKQNTAAKLNRRNPSPSPERPSMFASTTTTTPTHRRATSETKLPRDPSSSSSSAANLFNKNSSHSSLAGKRDRSHPEISKRARPSTNLKRSSSHKDVDKLKGAKTQVHFDLGNDNDTPEDEWVDASNSASPYLSRRGSVVSTGQSSTTKSQPGDESPRPQSSSTRPATPHEEIPDRETFRHKEYITSRLLQRASSSSAPPQMSTETASVRPKSGSPKPRHSPPSLCGTPKTGTLVGSAGEELTSRFVNGSEAAAEVGSFFTPTRSPTPRTESMRRPRSLGNLNQEHRDSISDNEGDSALAPRTRGSAYKAQPAEKSRTQQKLNLQRASSSIEPAQAGGGAGVCGASPLVGSSGNDNRDPRISKLLERTGMEYLVVRRYQNPIARSIARLSRLPANQKNQRIPRQNGAIHGKKPSELGGAGRYGLSQSLGDGAKSRPTTPRRARSVRTNGAGSSFEDERPQDRTSGSSDVDGDADSVAALLRNLWDKSMDLGAGHE